MVHLDNQQAGNHQPDFNRSEDREPVQSPIKGTLPAQPAAQPVRDEAYLLEAREAPHQRELVYARGYGIFTATHLDQNARLIFCTKTREAAVVDPGGGAKEFADLAKQEGLSIKAIWLTHSHPDHIAAVRELRDLTGAEVVASGNLKERLMRWQLKRICRAFGFDEAGLELKGMKRCPGPDIVLHNGDKLKLGENEFEAVFTPGHSPGHYAFWDRSNQFILSGDAFFSSGAGGRTDLPFGDDEKMQKTIDWFYELPDNTLCLSGHGSDFTIRQVKNSSYYRQKLEIEVMNKMLRREITHEQAKKLLEPSREATSTAQRPAAD